MNLVLFTLAQKTIYEAQTSNTITCGQNQVFETNTQQCICVNDKFEDLDDYCVCSKNYIQVQHGGPCLQCPPGSVANSIKSLCVCLDSIAYFDPIQMKCLQCDNNYVVNLGQTGCTSVCDNTFIDLQSKSCVSTCSIGFENLNRTKCIFSCLSETSVAFISSDNTKCVPSCSGKYLNSAGTKCLENCFDDSKSRFNPSSNQCTRPCDSPYYLALDNISCVSSCQAQPGSPLVNADQTICVSICEGSYISADKTRCVQSCFDFDQSLISEDNSSCVRNCVGYVSLDGKRCVKSCSVEQIYASNELDSSQMCYSDLVYLNQTTNQCVCKAGTFFNGHECKKCSSGVPNALKNACVQINNCDGFLNLEETMCIPSCQPNSKPVNKKCVCQDNFELSHASMTCVPVENYIICNKQHVFRVNTYVFCNFGGNINTLSLNKNIKFDYNGHHIANIFQNVNKLLSVYIKSEIHNKYVHVQYQFAITSIINHSIRSCQISILTTSNQGYLLSLMGNLNIFMSSFLFRNKGSGSSLSNNSIKIDIQQTTIKTQFHNSIKTAGIASNILEARLSQVTIVGYNVSRLFSLNFGAKIILIDFQKKGIHDNCDDCYIIGQIFTKQQFNDDSVCQLCGFIDQENIANYCKCNDPLKIFNFQTQQCECPQNTYFNRGLCIKCPIQSVSYQNSANCFCLDQFKIFDQTLGCVCKLNYYKIDNSCMPCPLGSNSIINSIQCVCLDQNKMPNYITNQCECKSQYYISGNICVSCPVDSLSIQNSESCQCSDSKKIHSVLLNLCVCKANFYVSGTECVPCPVGSTSFSNFAYCICSAQNYVPNYQTNQCQCKANYYISQTLGCVSCPFGSTSNQNSVSCVCDNLQKVPDYDNKICICLDNYYLSGTECIQCPSDSHSSPSKDTCLCTNSKKIFVFTSRQCECIENYYKSGAQCVQCPPNSVSLINSSQCTCLHRYKVPNYSQNACECVSNTYISGDQCIQCPPTSTSIQNSAICTCPSTMVINYAASSCQCQSGYRIVGSACVLCPPGSNSPQNSLICDCLQAFKVPNYSTNRCECAQNYFTLSSVCYPCPDFSTSGQNSDTCTCQANFIFNIITRTCQCRANYYASGALCLPCPAYSTSVQNSAFCTCDSGSLQNNLCPCPVTLAAASNSCTCQPGSVIFNSQCVLCATGSTSGKINSQTCVATQSPCGTKQIFYFRDIQCAGTDCQCVIGAWTVQQSSCGRQIVFSCVQNGVRVNLNKCDSQTVQTVYKSWNFDNTVTCE
ncbi:T9SS_type A sorting domain-containing protein [Hexamita inflata]|uniref:T9SS type A sorting domain-containing protein n=1 Tax=Hexamita inflata TaxID=28002 RepID=A0AA86PIG5_9EUKA|nr:T9SS type A sorting domain-containing protein [Hexamita inflata]